MLLSLLMETRQLLQNYKGQSSAAIDNCDITIQTKRMLFTVFFLILFVTRDVHTQCSGIPSNVTVALLESASFTSPGYPNIYGTNLNCVWFYNSGLGDDYFLVQIKDVYVDCAGDGIRLTDVQSGNIVVDNVCGDGVDTKLIGVAARLRIDFTADGNSRSADKGFQLSLTGVPNTDTALSICTAPSTIAATEENHVLISDNFPESYPGLDCQLTIRATPGRKIQITIDIMDLEGDGTTCQYDFLQFLDETGNQIAIYCGRWQFRPVINSVLILNGDTDIKFKSDDADNFLGFRLRFKLAESSTTTPTTSTTTPALTTTTTTPTTSTTTLTTSTTTPTTPSTPTTSTTTPTTSASTPTTSTTTPALTTTTTTTPTTSTTTPATSTTTPTTPTTTPTTTNPTTSTTTPTTSTTTPTTPTTNATLTTRTTPITSTTTPTTSTTTPTTPTTTSTTTTPTTSATTPITTTTIPTTRISTTAPATTSTTRISTTAPATTSTTRISTTAPASTSTTVSYSQTRSTTSKTTLTTQKSSVLTSARSVTPLKSDNTLLLKSGSLTEKPASDCGMINCIIPIMTAIGLLLSLMFVAMTVFCVSRKNKTPTSTALAAKC